MKRIALILLLLPSLAFSAESSPLIVIVAIAGIPMILAAGACLGILFLPTSPQRSDAEQKNTPSNELKFYFEYFAIFVGHVLLIVASFIPTKIFPKSEEVFEWNLIVVGVVVALKGLIFVKKEII